MKTTSLILICLGVFSLNGAAQTFKFSDIYMYGGGGTTMAGLLSAKETARLKSGLNTPSINNATGFSVPYGNRGSDHVGMMAAWDLTRRPERHQKLRIGFSAGTYTLNFFDYKSEYSQYRIDTLTSDHSNRVTYVDSFFSRSLNYNHEATMFNINVDYLRFLNPQNKVSFYAGTGVNFGVSLSNNVTANYFENSYVSMPSNYNFSYNGYPGYPYNYSGQSYSKELSTATNVRAYTLVGINYRLSKRSAFLRYMNIFGEFRMGLDVNAMQELDPSVGYYYGGQGGLRVSFNQPKAR